VEGQPGGGGCSAASAHPGGVEQQFCLNHVLCHFALCHITCAALPARVRARGAESATRATPYSSSASVKIICVSPASSLHALRAEALVLAHGKGHAPAAQGLHTNHLHDADAPRHLGEGDQIDDLVCDHVCSETERGPACAVARRLDSRACYEQRLHDRVPAPNYSEVQRRVAIIIEAGAPAEQRPHNVYVAFTRSEVQRRVAF
jgi:hypothetical protein